MSNNKPSAASELPEFRNIWPAGYAVDNRVALAYENWRKVAATLGPTVTAESVIAAARLGRAYRAARRLNAGNDTGIFKTGDFVRCAEVERLAKDGE